MLRAILYFCYGILYPSRDPHRAVPWRDETASRCSILIFSPKREPEWMKVPLAATLGEVSEEVLLALPAHHVECIMVSPYVQPRHFRRPKISTLQTTAMSYNAQKLTYNLLQRDFNFLCFVIGVPVPNHTSHTMPSIIKNNPDARRNFNINELSDLFTNLRRN